MLYLKQQSGVCLWFNPDKVIYVVPIEAPKDAEPDTFYCYLKYGEGTDAGISLEASATEVAAKVDRERDKRRDTLDRLVSLFGKVLEKLEYVDVENQNTDIC